MRSTISRRTTLAAGAAALALGAIPKGFAQSRTKLRFSSAFTEQDLRTEAYKNFADGIKDGFEFQPFWGNTLFKQGTELVALQRGNLEMCNLAPADISKQIPAWSIMTSAYLFRDVDHLKKTFKSDVGREFIKMARDQLGIQVITPVYFGARNVNLKPTKEIRTPADLAGIKLRMPPGEYWQFLGESIGVNPTPVAYAEVYTALQTGAIDGQDNPLVASRLMKFDEVTTQFVLTGHVLGYDVMVMTTKLWDALPPVQQAQIQSVAEKSIDAYTAKFVGQEKDVVDYLKKEGKKVYTPDLAAFRTFAQKNTSTNTAVSGPRARWSASTPSELTTAPRARAHRKPHQRAYAAFWNTASGSGWQLPGSLTMFIRPGAAGAWLRRRANDIAVALMALMFVSFLLQIGFRYVFNQPLGWTDEVTVLCWVWVVLWCAAFVLTDQEEIRFDIVYGLLSARTQRAFTAASSIAIVVLLLISLPATLNYVMFMKREHTAYLHMRFDILYAVYVIFALAVIAKHIRLAWRAIKGSPLEAGSMSDDAV